MLDQRVFTHFSGRWVPEVFDTKEYEDKRDEQHAEEQPADLVPGAGPLSPLGCFCLRSDKERCLMPVTQGVTRTHGYQTLTSCRGAEQQGKP